MVRNVRTVAVAATLILLMTSCGADQNIISGDGPIVNPAVQAGATQAQGAQGLDGPTLGNQELRIELDGETIEIDEVEELEELTLGGAPPLEDCAEVLVVVPSLDVTQCSYDPQASEVVVDSLTPGKCENGHSYVTLNRPDGSGAYVGVVGEVWFDISERALSLETVELICEETTG